MSIKRGRAISAPATEPEKATVLSPEMADTAKCRGKTHLTSESHKFLGDSFLIQRRSHDQRVSIFRHFAHGNWTRFSLREPRISLPSYPCHAVCSVSVEGRSESSATDEERPHLGNSQESQRLPWIVRCRNLEEQMVEMLAETEINRRRARRVVRRGPVERVRKA